MLTLRHVAWGNTEVIEFHAHQQQLAGYVCLRLHPVWLPLPCTNHSFGNLNIDEQNTRMFHIAYHTCQRSFDDTTRTQDIGWQKATFFFFKP